MTRRCVGAILAGGRATRFGGRAKGLEHVGGARVVDRVADALRAAADDIVLVADPARARDWLPGVRVIADVHPDIGSLGGLHAALAQAGGDVLVVAWDMPFVPAALLAALRARGESPDADAVLPMGDGGRPEPLCAWYSAGCLPAAERLVGSGERRAGALAEAVRAVLVDVGAFGAPSRLFANLNTPADLEVARRLAGEPHAE